MHTFSFVPICTYSVTRDSALSAESALSEMRTSGRNWRGVHISVPIFGPRIYTALGTETVSPHGNLLLMDSWRQNTESWQPIRRYLLDMD